MKVRLRRTDNKYELSVFDSKDLCHCCKEIDSDEFIRAFEYYSASYEIISIEDQEQSLELYEIIIE